MSDAPYSPLKSGKYWYQPQTPSYHIAVPHKRGSTASFVNGQICNEQVINTPRADRYDQASLTSETIRQSNRLHKAANESGSKFFDAKNSEMGSSRRFLEKVNRAGGKLPLQDMYPEQQGYFNDANACPNEVE